MFFARDPGDSRLPWLGVAVAVLAWVLYVSRGFQGRAFALLPLAALAVWTAVTLAWSYEPDRTWSYANRTFVYLAFAIVGSLIRVEPRRLLYGMGALLGAVCAWSLAGKALPWLYEDYGRIARLRGPVGYWNALALLGDIALPIGLCLATRARAWGTLLVFGWIVAIGLTYSRGGVLVALLVVALWLVLSGAWFEGVSTLLAAGIPAAFMLAITFSLPGLTSDGQSHHLRVEQGAVFGVALLFNAFGAVLLARYPLADTERVRRGVVVVIAVLVVAGLAGAAVKGPSGWRSFTRSDTTEVSNSASRFGDSGSNFRWAWWTQAWQGWKLEKVTGTGAGSFHVSNLEFRKSSLDEASEPHDLPVQFLSETGVVGLVLFLAAIGVLIGMARRRPGPQLALALALPAYFLHGLLDFDWDFAAVSAPVFLIAGTLAFRPSGELPFRPRPLALALATVLTIAFSASLVAVWLGNRWDGEAASAVGVNNEHAITLAQRARRVDPYLVDPLFQAALAEGALAATRTGAAQTQANAKIQAYYEKATRVQPHSATAWYNLGYFELNVLNCPQAAYTAINRFTTLNGQDPKNVIYNQALKEVNAGTAKC